MSWGALDRLRGQDGFAGPLRFSRRVATSTASEHDGHHFDAVLDTDNTGKQVRADKAYGSRQRQEMLGTLGFKDEI